MSHHRSGFFAGRSTTQTLPWVSRRGVCVAGVEFRGSPRMRCRRSRRRPRHMGPLDFSSSRPRAQPLVPGNATSTGWCSGLPEKGQASLGATPSVAVLHDGPVRRPPVVLLRASRTGELSREELAEVGQDAWLSRASARRATAWLTVSYNKLLIALLLLALGAGLALVGPRRVLWSRQLLGGAALALVIGSPNLVYQATHGWPQLTMGAALARNNAAEVRVMMWPFLALMLGPPLVPVRAAAAASGCLQRAQRAVRRGAAAGHGDHRHRGRRAAAIGEQRVRLVHGHGEAGQPGRGGQRGAGAADRAVP